MTLKDFYQTYSSDSVSGCANQLFTTDAQPVKRHGRTYFRLSRGGNMYSLLFSNHIDSTYHTGYISVCGDAAGDWDILSLRVGLCAARGEEPEIFHTVTFDKCEQKHVCAGDHTPFFCDPIPLFARGGEYLCYDITVRGACYPYHEEMVLSVDVQEEDGDWITSKKIPVPLMIGSDRPVQHRIAFFGDSITQGCGTEYDSYSHWPAKIAEKLDDSYSVWDLGIGFARASDAAKDLGWLARAKQYDTVNICLGVNDLLNRRTANELICDLSAATRSLRRAGCRVILFTVPPFDWTGEQKEHWHAVNRAIRGPLGDEADAVFDFAAVLGQPAPNEHLAIWGGHPDAAGCAAAAKAYLDAGLL